MTLCNAHGRVPDHGWPQGLSSLWKCFIWPPRGLVCVNWELAVNILKLGDSTYKSGFPDSPEKLGDRDLRDSYPGRQSPCPPDGLSQHDLLLSEDTSQPLPASVTAHGSCEVLQLPPSHADSQSQTLGGLVILTDQASMTVKGAHGG